MRDRIIRREQTWSAKHPKLFELYKIASVMLGGLLFALGLEVFLIPNGFLDGGVTGVSILLSKVLGVPMAYFLFVLNLPFVFLAWKNMGRRSAIRTTIGIATLTVATLVLHHMDPWTDEFFIALSFGGALLGIGVGLALRHSGALDGAETLASVIASKTNFPVSRLILAINLVVFGAAIFVVGLESALASALLFFFAVSPMIDRIVHGDNSVRTARVVTMEPTTVARVVEETIHRRISITEHKLYNSESDSFDETIYELSFAMARLEESEITEKISEVDPDASVIFMEVSSLHGNKFKDLVEGH